MSALFSEAEIRKAQKDLSFLASDWEGEVPFRIHESGHDTQWGLGSSPPFAPEFIGYVGGLTCKNQYCSRCRRRETQPPRDAEAYPERRNNHRVRVTRAFRKLRRHAPLEYDVLWMAVMYHLSVAEITQRLNDRAVLRGYPERYTPADVVVLVVAGVDKASRWL